MTKKKNDSPLHALSSGETQASFLLHLSRKASLFYEIRVADHQSATLFFVEIDF